MKKISEKIMVIMIVAAMLVPCVAFGAEAVPEVIPETVPETEPQPEPDPAVSIAGYTVELSEYFVLANGQDQRPQVKGVYLQDEDTDEIVNTLTEADYTVTYAYASGIPAESFAAAGEYKVIVTGQGTYADSAEALFTVTGTRQNVTVAQTKYNVYTNSKPFSIAAKTDGDGTGFIYSSFNDEIASVDENGVVTPHKPGRVNIIIETTGDVLSHPAKTKVLISVAPTKVYWKKQNAVSVKGNSATLKWAEKADVTRYEVMYSTASSFKASATKTKKTKKLTTTLKNLKRGRTYYVRIRALYISTDTRGNEHVISGKWSAVKKIKIPA